MEMHFKCELKASGHLFILDKNDGGSIIFSVLFTGSESRSPVQLPEVSQELHGPSPLKGPKDPPALEMET